MIACDALVEGILRSHHCLALVAVPRSMLEEEVDIALCFVRIFVARAILLLVSWWDIQHTEQRPTSSFLDDTKVILQELSSV